MTNEEKIETIARLVINSYNSQYESAMKIEVKDIQGKSRVARMNKARVMFAAVCRGVTDISLQQIGKFINRSHCDIIHLSGISHESFYFHDPVYHSIYEAVVSEYLNKVGVYEYVMYDVRAYAQKMLRLEQDVRDEKKQLMEMLNGTRDAEKETIVVRRRRLIDELNQLENA